jgi:phage tail-like protein
MANAPTEASAPDARPFTAFNFSVEITLDGVDGVSSPICGAAFSECDGLEITLEPKTIREGGRNNGPIHLAGAMSYGQLTLKRGMTNSFDLWKWFEQLATPGKGGYRTSASVISLAADGKTEQARFELTGCLPVKLKASALNAKDGLVAVEEIQIVYETMRLKPGAQT